MIQLKNASYNIEEIKEEIDELEAFVGWGDRNQMSLQSPDGSFRTGDGKIEYYEGWSETDFTALNIDDDWEIARFITDNNLYRFIMIYSSSSSS